jgi:hypothetical protein
MCYILKPANPKKAIDISDATINAMGTPVKALGTSVKSSLSLIPDIKSMARANPMPAQNAWNKDARKEKPVEISGPKNMFTFRTVTPNTAQLVVIRGIYIPIALYSAGLNLAIAISTACTNTAITRIKAIVLKYSKSNGTNRYLYTTHVIKLDRVITNITAAPIPKADRVCLETPIKGHRPRKRVKIKLLIKIALIAIVINSLGFIYLSHDLLLSFTRLDNPIRKPRVKSAPGGNIIIIAGCQLENI